MNPEPMTEEKRDEIIRKLKEKYPNVNLFEIVVDGYPDELFVARWRSRAMMTPIAKALNEGQADAEISLIQKCLVYPGPDLWPYDRIQSEVDPGLPVILAQKILWKLGYNREATVKNL